MAAGKGASTYSGGRGGGNPSPGIRSAAGLAPALARRLGEVMASLKGEGISILIAESNEVHVADLLSRVFRIERGAVERG